MKLCFIPSAVLGILAVAASVGAEPYSFTPWVEVKQSYSDNVLFLENSEESDYITNLTGGLTWEQNRERLKTSLSGQLNQFCYWENNELNALDYDVSGSLKYSVTERFALSSSARYGKDSQRDRDTETTGMLVTGDRKSANLSLGADYTVSELSQVEVGVDLGDSDRQEEDSFEDTCEDNQSVQVSLSFRRDLSAYFKNTVGLLNLMYLHYTGEEDTTYSYIESSYERDITVSQEYASDVYQFSTGFSYKISELYSLFCQAGASYTQTSEEQNYYYYYYYPDYDYGYGTSGASDSDESGSWGGIFSSGIDYKNEYWTTGLALSHDVRGANGTSGVVERTRLSWNLARKLSDKLSLTFGASAYLNKNEREFTSDEDTLTFNLQPGFRYRFKNDFILSGAWRFTTVEYREDDTSKTRNLVYFTLKKEFDFKDF